MNKLFKISRKSGSNLHWYTWSDDYRKKLESISDYLIHLDTNIVDLSPNEKYGMSYLVNLKEALPNNVRSIINEMAHLVTKLRSNDGIYLLNNLTTDKFPGKALHSLFSLLSEEIRSIKSGEALAFHSPIEEKVIDSGFPVHADLYRMKALFNVITYAENTNGGDITLLPASALNDAMNKAISMPSSIKNAINSAITHRSQDDMFDCIFDLLYGDHVWTSELTNEIEKRQLCFPAKEGVGYILIDGMWLHGRTAIKGVVDSKRLQRLVFDTEQSLSIPYLSKAVLHDIQQATIKEHVRKSKSLHSSKNNRIANNHIQWTSKSKAIHNSSAYS